MGSATSTNSYLDPPQLHGVLNNDGTYTLSALEMKKQSDFNYYVAKIIQGGLNLANLNKETNDVFTGKVSFVDLSDPDSETVINGGLITTGSINADLITTGTLQGITLLSREKSGEFYTGNDVTIENGSISIESSEGSGLIKADMSGLTISNSSPLSNDITVSTSMGTAEILGALVKLISSSNLSIDSGGTIYIGASSGQSGNVTIGQTGGTVNLIGTVNVNGVPI